MKEKLRFKVVKISLCCLLYLLSEFPTVDEGEKSLEFSVSGKDLQKLIESTSFAMAQQDVRYYLNGMLWELTSGQIRTVATDGHRMALADGKCDLALGTFKSNCTKKRCGGIATFT